MKAKAPIAKLKKEGRALNAIAAKLPELMGGSADLTGSNNTEIKGGGVFTAATRAGTPAAGHLHVEFYPPLRTADKLKYLAGSEQGGGTFISDTSPEESAVALRGPSTSHRNSGTPASRSALIPFGIVRTRSTDPVS